MDFFKKGNVFERLPKNVALRSNCKMLAITFKAFWTVLPWVVLLKSSKSIIYRCFFFFLWIQNSGQRKNVIFPINTLNEREKKFDLILETEMVLINDEDSQLRCRRTFFLDCNIVQAPKIILGAFLWLVYDTEAASKVSTSLAFMQQCFWGRKWATFWNGIFFLHTERSAPKNDNYAIKLIYSSVCVLEFLHLSS